MALKDWKIIKKPELGKNVYKKGDNYIYIDKVDKHYHAFISERGYKYNSIYLTYEHFKTKSQALSFAKDYMRKH